MDSSDKAGVQFPDSEFTLLLFVASMCVVGVVVRRSEAPKGLEVPPLNEPLWFVFGVRVAC
jgi:hypothetical protein